MPSRCSRGYAVTKAVTFMIALIRVHPPLYTLADEPGVAFNVSTATTPHHLSNHSRNETKHKTRCLPDPHDVTRQRCRPNTFILGVSKCGTSSVAAWMYKHPALRWVNTLGPTGELRESYMVERSRDPLSESRGMKVSPEANERHNVMDYTAHYITRPEVPFRIARVYGRSSRDGSLKYVVILREPARRAISSWEYKVASLKERRDFSTVVFDGMEHARELIDCRKNALVKLHPRTRQGGAITGDFPHLGLQGLRSLEIEMCNLRDFEDKNLVNGHIIKGLYAIQLHRWFLLFGRENFKVVFLEDVAKDPLTALEGIFYFLGLGLVDPEGEKGLRSLGEWRSIVSVIHNETNRTVKAKLDTQVTPMIVQAMRDFYSPHNRDLESLLGVALPSTWS